MRKISQTDKSKLLDTDKPIFQQNRDLSDAIPVTMDSQGGVAIGTSDWADGCEGGGCACDPAASESY